MKPGYKQTEVGVIPEEWQCARMSEIAKLESGHTPSKREPSYWGGSIPWVSLFDTEGLQGREIFETAKMVTEEGLNNSSARLLPKGTVVFSRTATVGKTTVMGRDMATSQDFANYICGPKLHNHFLVYLFRNMGRTWKSLMAGSIHNTIYMPVFKALQIILPPLPEQRAIATALSDVDGLLGGLDRLIAKKRDLKQAAMQQLLTGQTRLPGFHAEWRVKTFGEVAVPRRERIDPRRAGVHDFCIELEHIESGSGQIMGSTSTGAQSSLKSVFHPGDVLFGKLRAYLRKYWRATRHGVCSTEIWVLVPRGDGATSEFLFQIVQTEGFIDAASNSYGTHMPRSDWNAVQNYELKMPPLPEQTAIAEVLTEMDAELAGIEQRREKTRALKQAMMQELLTGKTRLI